MGGINAPGSRFGWRGALALPAEYFDAPTAAYTLAADAGAVALTGAAATLMLAAVLTAGSGGYAVAGAAVAMSAGRALAADSGGYTLTPTDAGLLRGRSMPADGMALTVSGADVGLSRTTAVTADGAVFVVAGSEVALRLNRVIRADAGSVAVAGAAVGMNLGFRAVADPAVFAWMGGEASFRATRRLFAETASLTSGTVGSEDCECYDGPRVILQASPTYSVTQMPTAQVITVASNTTACTPQPITQTLDITQGSPIVEVRPECPPPVIEVNTPGPQGPRGYSGASIPPIAFSYGDAPSFVWTAYSDGVIPYVRLSLDVPIDGALPTVLVTLSTSAVLLPSDYVDAATAGDYESTPDVRVAEGDKVRLTITPGVGASQGSGVLYIEFIPD